MLGDLISAGVSLFAGNSQRKAEEKARAENIAQQREFAQSGIQWKAEDARKAGIHPLYAMGASTNSFSPVPIGDTGTGAMAQAGQDIGRAINATRSPAGKVDAFTRTTQQLTLTRMGLENELLASQVAKINQAGHSAGIPNANSENDYLISGQGNALAGGAGLKEVMQRSPSRTGHAADELATVPDRGFARTPHGGYAMIPSMDTKNRIEDMSLYEAQHFIRNNIMPMFSEKYQSPPFPAKWHKKWNYNALTGEYYQTNKRRK